MGCALDVRWLEASLAIERGTFADYRELERFHYVAKRPAVWAGVWRAVYRRDDNVRVIAVGVLSHPVPSCAARQGALRLGGARYEASRIRWLNANLRTISRVIVHPQFRGIGVAGELVRVICAESGVRYVEAMAQMGSVVPLFERGGMTRRTCGAGKPSYYLWDRANPSH